jgi:hypothetical protein
MKKRKKYLKNLKKAWMAYARKQEQLTFDEALLHCAAKVNPYIFNPETQTGGFRPPVTLKVVDSMAIDALMKRLKDRFGEVSDG